MRLDKFLSEINFSSRKESKKYIKSGSITINNRIVKDPGEQVDENNDLIKYEDQILTYEKFVYFMLNKPDNYVSATEDNISKTVIDLFEKENRNDLFPVGRLDKDTVGLLIITNDGELCHKLTSPNHNIEKKYYVKCERIITDSDIEQLKSGVELIGDGVTKPATVQRIDNNIIILGIKEGKYHQVKRMLAAVNNKVCYLKRLSIGEVTLDESLQEGTYRKLTEKEIELLKG